MSKTAHRDHHPPKAVLYAVLFGLFVIWSNSFHAVAYFRNDVGVSASALVTLRYGPVALFCLPYLIARRRELRALAARDGPKLLLMGLLMVPGYNLALNWGQGRVPPATASLIITMNPVFTCLLAAAFLGERPTWSRFLGLAIALSGVGLLVRTQQGSYGAGYSLYALVVLLAPLAWAVSTVLGKPITGRGDSLLITFAATGAGSAPFLATLLVGTGGVHQTLASLDAVGWVALLHLSVLCTIVGFAAWFWALRHLPASSVAAFVFLNPPLTSLFGVIWGTETFHWSTAVFGLITLSGVALNTGALQRTAARMLDRPVGSAADPRRRIGCD